MKSILTWSVMPVITLRVTFFPLEPPQPESAMQAAAQSAAATTTKRLLIARLLSIPGPIPRAQPYRQARI